MLQEGMMSFALLGAEWVLWVLVALSVLCVAVAIERAVYLSRDASPRQALQGAIEAFLKGGEIGVFREKITALDGFEARIIKAGMEVSDNGPEAAERAMVGVASAEKLRMERGISVLATVGSNAPFIGLFGTVLGIIKAFADLARAKAEAAVAGGEAAVAGEAVMEGISEALVATAVGLVVAIPAVVLFNIFSRWVRGRLGRSESLAQLVLARIPEHTTGR